MSGFRFSQRLLNWFDHHGRKDLPWQQAANPYRVWVSEIMLQQTQVATVIPYYGRFMQRFPGLESLADADQDDVLYYWSGLGYYSRARNLHKTARLVHDQHAGQFPQTLDEMMALPGIGRSTAGAILSLACGQRQPILDGNVKRVLTRFHAIEGWSGNREVQNELWELAERYTPRKRVADYTQAIMDLGATLCTRSRPYCDACPVQAACVAHAQGRVGEFPYPKPKKNIPVRKSCFLILKNRLGEVLLQKRPPAGIWGGLWSLPECGHDEEIETHCREQYGLEAGHIEVLPDRRHTFTHFHLQIQPLCIAVKAFSDKIMESGEFVWYNSASNEQRGLPAPVRRLLRGVI